MLAARILQQLLRHDARVQWLSATARYFLTHSISVKPNHSKESAEATHGAVTPTVVALGMAAINCWVTWRNACMSALIATTFAWS
jgi:hypothetical protein